MPKELPTFYGAGEENADDETILQVENLHGCDAFLLHVTAGSVYVLVTLDGTSWTEDPLSLQDFGAEDNNPVLTAAAKRIYGARLPVKGIRVVQSGNDAAAVVLKVSDV